MLREYCARQGYELVTEYVDNASGSDPERAGLVRMFNDARQRKFDVLIFWALDRFSREGVLATLEYLERLNSYGIAWRSYTEQYLDSTGMFREAIVSILATLAKQERVRIQERVMAGLDRAKRAGKILGGKRKIFDREAVREYHRAGHSLRQTAEHFGLKKDTVSRAIKERT